MLKLRSGTVAFALLWMSPVVTSGQVPPGPTPIQIATTGYTIVKTLLGLIHTDNYNAQIARELRSIEANERQILDQLGTLSSALDRLQGSVDAERQENLNIWHAWFTGVLDKPVDEFSTEVEAYARVSRPSRTDTQKHLARMRQIYEDFENPMTQGIAYKNPIAVQLCIAIIAEQRAGELADPRPAKGDELMVAHRLQVLLNRLQLLGAMTDASNAGSIANSLDFNSQLSKSLGADIAFVDSHYVGRDLPYFTETFHAQENRSDQYCQVTTMRRHLAFITKDDAGYKLTDHIQPDEKHDDSCHNYHQGASHEGNGGGHRAMMESLANVLPDHLPGVPPADNSSSSETDWRANVAKYQTGWLSYNQAVANVQQLSPVEDTLMATLNALDGSFKTLRATCVAVGHVDCDSETPHVLLSAPRHR